jgi:ankyrin repeat protein
VNYLSLRTKNLDVEDRNGITILMHMILQNNYKMVQRLLIRGASIDFVNKHGKTALHICVESKLLESVKYLLFKGANPHMLDFDELDCCDKAKANGMSRSIMSFNNCSLKKKMMPIVPEGKKVVFQYAQFYQS